MALRSELRRFWQNLIVGLVVAGLLLALRDSALLRRGDEIASDLAMRLNVSLARMTGAARGQPDLAFTVIDPDVAAAGATEAGPESVPLRRDRLQQLIGFAADARAALIVVDADLGQPGVDPTADTALRDYLAGYPADAPPLILLRWPRRADPGGDAAPVEFGGTVVGEPTARNVFFAAPAFAADPRDGVVRRWQLVQQGCHKGGGLALTSVPLAARALLRDRLAGGDRNASDLRASVGANTPTGCDSGSPRIAVKRPVVVGGALLEQPAEGERLIFTLPWDRTGVAAPDLRVLPAAATGDPQAVAGRIVLIAGSGATRDLQRTPLGPMPNGFVMLNGIKSLALFGPMTPLPDTARLAVLLGFVVLLAWLFAAYGNLLKVMAATLLALIFFVPLAFWFFRYGLWFDFIALLLAIKAGHSLSKVLEVRALRRRLAESEAAAAAAGETPAPADSAPAAAAGEQRLEVRLRRMPDGGYIAATGAPAGGDMRFEVAADGLRRDGDDYQLCLRSQPRQ